MKISKTQNSKVREKSTKPKTCSLKSVRLLNIQQDQGEGKKKTCITNIRNERGDITTQSTRGNREYYNFDNKYGDLDEMDIFLEKDNLNDYYPLKKFKLQFKNFSYVKLQAQII